MAASSPTVGAMICPSGSDAPSCTVTMPMTSSASLITTGSNPSRSAMSAAIRLNVSASVGSSGEEVDPLARDHDELRGVERVGAFAQDLALRSALAAGAQERATS